jgi:hypothetical protein
MIVSLCGLETVCSRLGIRFYRPPSDTVVENELAEEALKFFR